MRFVTACGTRRLTLIAVASAALGFASLAQAAKTELLVYSALEADQIKAYKVGFEKAHPEIELRFVRDSTGIITARLLAEKANPQADVIWGVAATSLMLLDKQGMLQPYAPRNLAKVRSTMRDPAATPTWVGMDLWSSAVCFNTVEGGKRKLPTPASWADLTKPEFKGSITMPHPASSGTGYLMVAAWLQMMGEDKGWAYMDALHQNIGVYTHSGSKPCRQAGAGEFPVGLSFEYRANKTKKDGAPIDIVFPREGLGWDVEATAIMKTSKKQEAAKVLADWAVTPDANKLYAANFAILALPEAQEKHEFIPADLEKRLAKNDFGWAAANRDRILTEWARRYESKAEKK
ncbi:putative 2-aminoethylphosphonate ABC transporter substrate-binding protein [Comamonas sp. Y6]|uniref:2-aminoethylphosphonate ABC transporter substrate-binding protein n=1 Tax=Comamonas resistens TaxID=3046670 RepID=A0ABY8SPQ6_9BURK|nr:putative 2-aminoethylphosphonate ABC transporter substrate-binding protein [Comamonas resistens]MDL5036575.1 putative 2-aminoethylphosphonate ABC transporter substrate-binding protein [Comamonas resistens]WHS64913.1 putative 2-aminoethylphosphonate ABC transporter substrate-binding protein [Comamonas resistens]